MKENFSPLYIENAKKQVKYTLLYWRMKFSPFILKFRLLLRKLLKRRVYHSKENPSVTQNLEKSAAHFQKYGWVYVENIFSDDFHKEILKNWPARMYFNPPYKTVKSYDTGFGWSHGYQALLSTDHDKQHQTIYKFFEYLRSKEFEERITTFVGKGAPFICYSFALNSTYPGSEVMPHKDAASETGKLFLNIVFFINGAGGKDSGNLSLSKDNQLKDIIFEPYNLKNACLIYDSLADFYHGFRPVAKGKFRWGIISQFCEKSYVEK